MRLVEIGLEMLAQSLVVAVVVNDSAGLEGAVVVLLGVEFRVEHGLLVEANGIVRAADGTGHIRAHHLGLTGQLALRVAIEEGDQAHVGFFEKGLTVVAHRDAERGVLAVGTVRKILNELPEDVSGLGVFQLKKVRHGDPVGRIRTKMAGRIVLDQPVQPGQGGIEILLHKGGIAQEEHAFRPGRMFRLDFERTGQVGDQVGPAFLDGVELSH